MPPSRKLKNGRWQCAKHHLSCPAVAERRKRTHLEKYGVDNPFKLWNGSEMERETRAARSARRKQSVLERHGVSNPFRMAGVHERSREALRRRYGVDNPAQVPGAMERATETLVRRYGRESLKGGRGGYQFRKSKIADRWLDEQGVTHREVWIEAGGKHFKVDGLSDDGKTVYEFYGNYWHGNPALYEASVVNPQAHATMGDLYQRTIDREAALRTEGYRLITIWEDAYKRGSRSSPSK